MIVILVLIIVYCSLLTANFSLPQVISFPRELLDALFLAELADEENAVVFCHDISVEALDDDLSGVVNVYDGAFSVVEVYVVADDGIAVEVLLALDEQ